MPLLAAVDPLSVLSLSFMWENNLDHCEPFRVCVDGCWLLDDLANDTLGGLGSLDGEVSGGLDMLVVNFALFIEFTHGDTFCGCNKFVLFGLSVIVWFTKKGELFASFNVNGELFGRLLDKNGLFGSLSSWLFATSVLFIDETLGKTGNFVFFDKLLAWVFVSNSSLSVTFIFGVAADGSEALFLKDFVKCWSTESLMPNFELDPVGASDSRAEFESLSLKILGD